MTKSLTDIAHDGKSLLSFVKSTVASYTKLATRLHHTACATFYHAAQYGDCDALNLFHKGLRVNDRTALRVWIGQHATFMNLEDGTVKPWIRYTEKEGFRVVKGKEIHRKDMFNVEEVEEGKTTLITLKPFFEKDVKEQDSLTLEALISMLAKAAEKAEKKSEDEGIPLPTNLKSIVADLKRTASSELDDIKRAKTEAE